MYNEQHVHVEKPSRILGCKIAKKQQTSELVFILEMSESHEIALILVKSHQMT